MNTTLPKRGFDARRLILVVLTALLVETAPSSASSGATVGALAEAGATSLSARGVDATWSNPAVLAWDGALYVRVASGSGLLQNDTYTWHDYGRWNGANWKESDKQEILEKIGTDGFHGRFETGLLTPGAAGWGWALAGRSVQAGRVQIPREYAEFALFGNQLGQSIDLPASDGDGIWFFDVGLSHGRPLGSYRGFQVAAGASIRWLLGIQYGEVRTASSTVSTTMDALNGSISAESRTAEGGSGQAFDLALALRKDGTESFESGPRPGVHGPYEFGFSLRNLGGSIRWDRTPRLQTDRAVADSLTLSDVDREDPIETTSSTVAIPAFTEAVPAELTLAGAMGVADCRLELGWTQGFEESALTSTRPRVALGGSLQRWTWVTPKAGLAVGGIDGPVLALGAQFRVWMLNLDVAYQNVGGIDLSLPKGVALGFAITVRPWTGREPSVTSGAGAAPGTSSIPTPLP